MRKTMFLARCFVLCTLSIYAQAQTDALCELQYDAAGREDSIVVISWNHGIKSPSDNQTKQTPSFEITKSVDHATKSLMRAHADQTSGHMTLLCDYGLATDASGGSTEQHYFTIELEDATISEIRMEQLNNKYKENMQHSVREHIEFRYQDIHWHFNQR